MHCGGQNSREMPYSSLSNLAEIFLFEQDCIKSYKSKEKANNEFEKLKQELEAFNLKWSQYLNPGPNLFKHFSCEPFVQSFQFSVLGPIHLVGIPQWMVIRFYREIENVLSIHCRSPFWNPQTTASNMNQPRDLKVGSE